MVGPTIMGTLVGTPPPVVGCQALPTAEATTCWWAGLSSIAVGCGAQGVLELVIAPW